MFRPLSIALCLTLAAGTASAQTIGGPPIAYVKRVSNGDEIYLVNSNGSALTRLYKAPSKVAITMLDLRPGGGEIAFTERFTTLRILSIDANGRAGAVRTIRQVSSPCTVEAPDYRADGTLIYIEGCSGATRAAWTVQPGAAQRDPTSVFSAFRIGRVRWSRLGDALYYPAERDDGSNRPYLYRRSAAGGAADELGPIEGYSTFDIGRDGEKVIWSLGNGTFKMLDLGIDGATTANAVVLECPRAAAMSYSPGDTQIVYATTAAKGGNYVMVGSSSCGGSPNALTGKGSWGSVDWRN